MQVERVRAGRKVRKKEKKRKNSWWESKKTHLQRGLAGTTIRWLREGQKEELQKHDQKVGWGEEK